MKICIDIGHPAHIHYFKNFASIMEDKGHELLFIVRDKETTLKLIENIGLNYVSRGKGGGNIFTKLLLLPIINIKIYRIAKRYNPDIFLSFASPYAAHVSRLLGIPHITFDDTEHAVFAHKLYRPFSEVIISPSCYMRPKGKNQYFFNSYMELSYLHPTYFVPEKDIRKDLKINEGEKYVVVRFVSWDANHDVGQKGFTTGEKIKLVEKLTKMCRVFISSESELPAELKSYQLNTHPSKLHSILEEASLYIGEGSTTAAESSLLGTPSIYVNSLKVGYCEELEKKYKLCYQLTDLDDIIDKAKHILHQKESKKMYKKRLDNLLAEKIDTTKFMVWFMDNWPFSFTELKRSSIPNFEPN